MSEEIERVIDEVLDRTLPFGDTDALGFGGTYTWDLDDWGEVKDVREVFARETNFSTQKLDEFLDEM